MSDQATHSAVAPMSFPPLSRPELRGRAGGVLILTLFGLSWASWGSAVGVSPAIGVWITVFTAAFGIACLVGAAIMFARARTAPLGRNDSRGREVGRRFGVVVGIEFLGLGLIAWLLSGLGQEQLIPVVICFGVGVHFFPLARLFGLSLYFGTGVALCLVSAMTVVVAFLTSDTMWWTVVPGLGAAVTLFLTCGILISTTLRRSS